MLGQFPTADDESLIPLRWIEAAFTHDSRLTTHDSGIRRAAADIARFGNDSTVIGMRVGRTLKNMEVMHGADLMKVAGRIRRLAYEEHPESIAVDAIGLGAGVVDRLREMEVEGVESVNVGLPAHDTERFLNRRAELYWGLRERFRVGDITIPPIPETEGLAEELAAIKYRITSRGQIQLESKDEMKKRGRGSPDRADMLAMLFDSTGDWAATLPQTNPAPSAAQKLRAEMTGW